MGEKYTIGTWNASRGAFTPHRGIGQCVNVSWQQMLRVLRRLKAAKYDTTRDGGHSVKVVKTTGLNRDQACEELA